jgi:hypothetical protein
MDVSHLFRAALFSALFCSLCFAQSGCASYDPAKREVSRKSNDGFIDYTLKRINSADVDYGKSLDQNRKLLLEETIENGYFWSNLIALALLACLFLIIVWQHQNHTRCEWITAEILVQQEHALARANEQLSDVTSKNHNLVNSLTSARETAIRSLSNSILQSEDSERPMGLARVPRQQPAPSKTAVSKTTGDRNASSTPVAQPGNQIALFTPDVDLMMTVNSLKQQLARAEEQNTLLQRRIAATVREVDSKPKHRRANGDQSDLKSPTMA